ncbi:MAG: (4Fe-4S)-binding protein [Algibacter sp.]
MGKIKEYSNDEVTVMWEPEKCMHSALCAKGLSAVFQPREKPWIKIDAAETDMIIGQVKKCPSRALSYYKNA